MENGKVEEKEAWEGKRGNDKKKTFKRKSWPKEINKAVYTAALVVDGWAGAENLEKRFVTDRPTNGPTDRKVAYRVACP